MPIYDLSYRAYTGTFSTHRWRWATIAKAGLSYYLTRKLYLAFLFIGLIQPIARGVYIWISHSNPTVNIVTINADFFRQMVLIQGFFLMMACIWPGALLIARDLKTNAIQLYLSKPLSRLDYVVGKLAIVAAMGGILITGPALILFLMELGLSTTSTFITSYWWLPLAIVGYSAVVILAAGLIVLAASSVSRSGAYAGLLFFGLIFFSQVAAGLLTLITRFDAFGVVSLQQLTEQIASFFFGGTLEFGRHPLASFLVYTFLIAVSSLVLHRRVKAVEIVT